MPYLKFLFTLLLLGLASAKANNAFETVYDFFEETPGNIAVSQKGDVYVTIHPVSGSSIKVAKITKKGYREDFTIPMFVKPQNNINAGISNAIGIYIDKKDHLWILDMGSKSASPKFIVWNLKKERLEKLITIPLDVIRSNSFLQDFAIDEEKDFAFIADMTMGSADAKASPAIIAINIKTGEAKRLLENSRFVKSTKPMMAEGKIITTGTSKKGLMLDINPITIDSKNEWVYFGGMSEGEIYRIHTSALRDFKLSRADLEERIESMGYKPYSDGFKIDKKQNIYIGDVNKSEIGISKNKEYTTLIQSPDLIWVDGLFVAKDGYVYAVINQLNRHPDFSANGKDSSAKPYKIIKFKQAN